MKRTMLIDAILRQTMVLIARLATADGERAPLSHVSNQVFLQLAKELRAKDIGNKIIADMFGITLRAYQSKLRRLEDLSVIDKKSIWQRLVSHMQTKGVATKESILADFGELDGEIVSGILNDLVINGLMTKSGRAKTTTYRWASESASGAGRSDVSATFLWVIIHRLGPVSRSELPALVPNMKLSDIETALDSLVQDLRIHVSETDGEPHYASEQCIIDEQNDHGWEASAYDHFRAVSSVLSSRAEKGAVSADIAQHTGGSTYYYEIDDNHPCKDEALSLLAQFRKKTSDLRRRVDEYNASRNTPIVNPSHAIFYMGQSLEEASWQLPSKVESNE